MELTERTLRIASRKDIVTIFALGDLHIASSAFEEHRLKKAIKKIEDTPNSVWIGTGDFGECISKTDIARFDQESVREPYRSNLHRYHQLEAQELKKLFEPIADKALGLLVGNHENSLRQKLNFDLTWELCNHLGCKNLSMEGIVRLNIERKEGHAMPLIVFAAHGFGGGRRFGGKFNKLSDIQSYFEADIFLMAHVHSCGAAKEMRLTVPRSGKLRLKETPKLLIIVPAFYKTYQEGMDNYASKLLYPPSALGMAEIRARIVSEQVSLPDGTNVQEDAWDIETTV